MNAQQSCILYVSPRGCDTWSGQLPDPDETHTDGPFATLEAARDAIRRLKISGEWPARGVTVSVRGGDYVLNNTFFVGEEDSGTEEGPVTYRAYRDEHVRLLGGRHVGNFRPVSDPALIDRLDEAARPHVLEADLKILGITDFGQFRSRGFGRSTVPAHLELFFHGRPMMVARWPNDSFVTIAGIPEAGKRDDDHGRFIGELAHGFYYDGDRPKRWKSFRNVWLHGYWAWDWANSYEEIAHLDTEQRLITTKPPYGNYGFRTGHRFYFLNVLEELDSPGEYYVDSDRGMLYFWPPEPIEEGEVLVSVLETPMVLMEDVSHVTLQGFILEAGRGTGIEIRGGNSNLIADCRLRTLGNHAVVVEGGRHHGVAGCEISETGDGGIFLSGGDRKTLTPCGHDAHNNHISRISRWSRCYTPAIHASGVGIRMTHNLIHDLPHSAIIFWGNEMLIEFNEIHHVTLETADAGAIYTGRDFTARGNIIRYNYIHDTGGYDWGTMAVYIDDCSSGQVIYGNVFVRVQRAAFIGGGRDNIVENNIFVDCKPAVWIDARGMDRRVVWHTMVYRTMKERLDEMKHHDPPYSERYPALCDLDRYYAKDDGVPPEGNIVARNVCVGGVWIEASWHGGAEKYLTVVDNLVDVDPHFVDAVNNDYRLREDSPAFTLGFTPIPCEKIGRE